MAKVAIIMGSKSDLDVMVKAQDLLKELKISCSFNIFSAHRTPEELSTFVTEMDNDDTCEVFIAGAGMSAALAGCIAAHTVKPVISVPLSGGKLKGVESVLSTLEMPPGIPVLSVGIDAAKNAALAAASIIAINDISVRISLRDFREKQKQKVLDDNEWLNH